MVRTYVRSTEAHGYAPFVKGYCAADEDYAERA